jgi:hypothetical protein
MSAHEFDKIIREFAQKKGVQLPEFTYDSPLRTAYLDLLTLNGLTEDAVCGIVLDSESSNQVLHANARAQAVALRALFDSWEDDGDPQVFRAAASVLLMYAHRPNANFLINNIGRVLTSHIAALGVEVPQHYLGVFPMGTFNAQCLVHNDANLILLDNGCFSMLEIAGTCIVESRSDSRRAEGLLWQVLEGYRQSSAVVNHEQVFGVRKEDGLSVSLTTSSEEFVICHELGHLVLGHLNAEEMHVLHDFRRGARKSAGLLGWLRSALGRESAPSGGLSAPEISVLLKTQFDEFVADAWATARVIERAKGRGEEACVIACAGPVLFLAVAHLFESLLRAKGQEISDGHPAACDRLYMVNCLLEVLGQHENAYVARRVLEFVNEVGTRFIPGFEMPPLLSRELNRKLHEVLTVLDIDMSDAKFITDFR